MFFINNVFRIGKQSVRLVLIVEAVSDYYTNILVIIIFAVLNYSWPFYKKYTNDLMKNEVLKLIYQYCSFGQIILEYILEV